jgi:hypothetical protein
MQESRRQFLPAASLAPAVAQSSCLPERLSVLDHSETFLLRGQAVIEASGRPRPPKS